VIQAYQKRCPIVWTLESGGKIAKNRIKSRLPAMFSPEVEKPVFELDYKQVNILWKKCQL